MVEVIVAMSRRRYPALTGPIGVSAISSSARNSVIARTEKRNWPRRIVPPAPFAFAACTAIATSLVERPSARMRSGSTSMRISSSGAPVTATLATPGDLLEAPRVHVGGGAAEEAQVVQAGEPDHCDRAFAGVAREERRTRRLVGEPRRAPGRAARAP